MEDVTAVVLAGGKGTRLRPLTEDRAKPVVRFGGSYRLIDFPLTNCYHSRIDPVFVLTQYEDETIRQYIDHPWKPVYRKQGLELEVVSSEQTGVDHPYRGTADAVDQNIGKVRRTEARHVLILAADHVYGMDYRTFLKTHRQYRADVTVSAVPCPVEEASSFGVLRVNAEHEITGFQEKPTDPSPMPNHPEQCLVSMGIYWFRRGALAKRLSRDAQREQTSHDFGKDILPAMVKDPKCRVQSHLFSPDTSGTRGYWRDVGDLSTYYQAHMDLLEPRSTRDLLGAIPGPVGKENGVPYVQNTGTAEGGSITNSIVSGRARVEGGTVRNSVLSPGVEVNEGVLVEESVVLDDVRLPPNRTIRQVVIDRCGAVKKRMFDSDSEVPRIRSS